MLKPTLMPTLMLSLMYTDTNTNANASTSTIVKAENSGKSSCDGESNTVLHHLFDYDFTNCNFNRTIDFQHIHP